MHRALILALLLVACNPPTPTAQPVPTKTVTATATVTATQLPTPARIATPEPFSCEAQEGFEGAAVCMAAVIADAAEYDAGELTGFVFLPDDVLLVVLPTVGGKCYHGYTVRYVYCNKLRALDNDG